APDPQPKTEAASSPLQSNTLDREHSFENELWRVPGNYTPTYIAGVGGPAYDEPERSEASSHPSWKYPGRAPTSIRTTQSLGPSVEPLSRASSNHPVTPSSSSRTCRSPMRTCSPTQLPSLRTGLAPRKSSSAPESQRQCGASPALNPALLSLAASQGGMTHSSSSASMVSLPAALDAAAAGLDGNDPFSHFRRGAAGADNPFLISTRAMGGWDTPGSPDLTQRGLRSPSTSRPASRCTQPLPQTRDLCKPGTAQVEGQTPERTPRQSKDSDSGALRCPEMPPISVMRRPRQSLEDVEALHENILDGSVDGWEVSPRCHHDEEEPRVDQQATPGKEPVQESEIHRSPHRSPPATPKWPQRSTLPTTPGTPSDARLSQSKRRQTPQKYAKNPPLTVRCFNATPRCGFSPWKLSHPTTGTAAERNADPPSSPVVCPGNSAMLSSDHEKSTEPLDQEALGLMKNVQFHFKGNNVLRTSRDPYYICNSDQILMYRPGNSIQATHRKMMRLRQDHVP
ncbi:hypothetical protein CYMTET_31630, partial [Cymbomonas tetramitiformis]